MPKVLDKSCTFVQYADDTTLLSFHSNLISARRIIESSFNRTFSNFHFHQLMINVDKTQFIHFSAPSQKKTHSKLQAANRKLPSQNI